MYMYDVYSMCTKPHTVVRTCITFHAIWEFIQSTCTDCAAHSVNFTVELLLQVCKNQHASCRSAADLVYEIVRPVTGMH